MLRLGSDNTRGVCEDAGPYRTRANIVHRGALLIRQPTSGCHLPRWGRQTGRCAIICHMKETFLHPPRDPTARGGRPSGFGWQAFSEMTRGRCAKGLRSEYGAKPQAKRSGIYETRSVILSVTREDAKQKRESHFQVRGVEVLRSEYGAKPQGAAVAGSTK